MTGSNSMEVRRRNRNKIYRIIHQKKRISKQEIANQLQLSLPTVSQNLSELYEKDLIYENGNFESTGGRKAKGISCNMNAKMAIGLDITKSQISGVLVDLSGNAVFSVRIQENFSPEERYYVKLKGIVEQILSWEKVQPDSILGIGISMPGIISGDHKTILYAPVVETTTLYEDLKKYLPYPYVILNDAKAGGFAELWHSPHMENMVYLSLSNSVGGAVLMNHNLYYGAGFLSGEIGHMTLVIDGKPCYCGQKGCMDAYCSAKVLAEYADGNLDDFFYRLAEGNESCRTAWETYLKYLAVAINNIRNCLDCEIVVGGYVGSHMGEHLEKLQQYVAERSTFATDGSFIRNCILKFESSAIGAALFYIDNFIKAI